MFETRKVAFCIVVVILTIAFGFAFGMANDHPTETEAKAQAPVSTDDWWPTRGQCNYVYGVVYGPAVLIQHYDYGYASERIDYHESHEFNTDTVCIAYENQAELEAAWPYAGDEIGATFEAPTTQ